MLKKILYIGLGISIIVVKKSVSYLLEKKEQVGEQFAAAATIDDTATSRTDGEDGLKEDDLTEISGIGPTYAKRLMEAGITTFAALSKKSPEELRTVTKASGKSGDPESWIKQAASLA